MDSARANESVSDCCTCSVLTEIQTALGRIVKTKENKAGLNQLQKILKRVNALEDHKSVSGFAATVESDVCAA